MSRADILADETPRPGGTIRCAEWTRAQGLDPIGSAGSYQGFLLVDWPLPWPRDVGEIPPLAPLAADLKAQGTRLQALVAARDAPERLVAHYVRQPGGGGGADGEGTEDTDWFVRFRRNAVRVSPDEVAPTIRRLLATTGPGGEPAPSRTGAEHGGIEVGGAEEGGNIGEGAEGDGHHLLVCTHGRRDRCCGAAGTDLALRLAADPGCLGAGVELSRTSHTGGHRFAPTAVVLPEGTLWAFADAELLGRVVRREGDVADVVGRYRGCAGLASPALQALERAVLAEVGWELWDRPRSGRQRDDGWVRLDVAGLGPGGAPVSWEGQVRSGPSIPAPACGGPASVTPGTASELVLSGFRRMA